MGAHKQSLIQSFKAMDTSGDQLLSKDELRVGFKKSGIIMKNDEFNKLFKRIDINGNGMISVSEYLTAVETCDVLDNDIQLETAFNILANNDTKAVKKQVLVEAMNKGWLANVNMWQLFIAAYVVNDDIVIFIVKE